jgi:hypothetical protein
MLVILRVPSVKPSEIHLKYNNDIGVDCEALSAVPERWAELYSWRGGFLGKYRFISCVQILLQKMEPQVPVQLFPLRQRRGGVTRQSSPPVLFCDV